MKEGNDMADCAIDKESFVFTYSAKQQSEIEKIKSKYIQKEESKMEKLIRLDKKAERPGTIASMVLGLVGTLILGVGMCFTLVWNTSIEIFIAGIVIGILGMVIAGFAYPTYKRVTKKERAKIADEIITLSNELSV